MSPFRVSIDEVGGEYEGNKTDIDSVSDLTGPIDEDLNACKS